MRRQYPAPRRLGIQRRPSINRVVGPSRGEVMLVLEDFSPELFSAQWIKPFVAQCKQDVRVETVTTRLLYSLDCTTITLSQ